MSDISTKLQYLNTTKGKIKDVINMTGVNITSDTTFRNYATKLYDGYVSVLKDKNTLLDNMPKGTSAGTITDAVDLPVYEDKMSKESTQNGEPTPENPVEVKTVKGYRNLFNKNTITNSKRISVSTGNLTNNESTFVTDYIELKSNTIYHIKNLETFGSSYYGLALYDEDKQYVAGYTYNSLGIADKNDFNISFSDNFTYVRFSFVTETSDLNVAQITESTEKLPYVPYGTNWIYTAVSNGTDTNYYTIPLNDNEIAGIGDYKDELIVDRNGHCWLNKKIGKVVLDGSENWQSTGSAYAEGIRFHQFAISVNDKKNGYFDLLCNRFVNVSPAKPNKIVGSNDNKRMLINIADSYLNDDLTVSGFKNWLSTHNTDVYYVLATSEIIDLNYTVDIELFNGVNNISNSDDMDMEIKYIKDTYE